MLEAEGEGNLRITETNSEEEEDHDIVRLRSELSRQQMLVKEAVQSCEHYKRISESLLQAMTQMTAENNSGYEAILYRQRELQLAKQEKNMQDAQRIINSRLDAAMGKAVAIENAKRQVEEQLERVRADCLAKQHTISKLCREIQDLRLEMLEAKQKHHNEPVSQKAASLSSSSSLLPTDRSEQLLSFNRRIAEELEEKFRRILHEQSTAYQTQKKILEATIEANQFENKLLKKDIDHLTKDFQKVKHELQQAHRRSEQRLNQQEGKWRTLHEQQQTAVKKLQEKLVAKEQQLRQAKKDNASLRVKFNKATSVTDEQEKKIAELQKLLAEAKYHIINFDLENKTLNGKVRSQQRSMHKQTQKLTEELQAVKQAELSRSRALQSLLSRSTNKPKTARNRHDSNHCSITLDRSMFANSAQNDPNLCNLLESLLSRASSTANEDNQRPAQNTGDTRRSSPQSQHTAITKALR